MCSAEAVAMAGKVLYLNAIYEVVHCLDLARLIRDFGFQAWGIVAYEAGGRHVEECLPQDGVL